MYIAILDYLIPEEDIVEETNFCISQMDTRTPIPSSETVICPAMLYGQETTTPTLIYVAGN
jgi:hypothetical protein